MDDFFSQIESYTEQLYIELCFRLIMDDANHSGWSGNILWLDRLECIDTQENSHSEKGGSLCR